MMARQATTARPADFIAEASALAGMCALSQAGVAWLAGVMGASMSLSPGLLVGLMSIAGYGGSCVAMAAVTDPARFARRAAPLAAGSVALGLMAASAAAALASFGGIWLSFLLLEVPDIASANLGLARAVNAIPIIVVGLAGPCLGIGGLVSVFRGHHGRISAPILVLLGAVLVGGSIAGTLMAVSSPAANPGDPWSVGAMAASFASPWIGVAFAALDRGFPQGLRGSGM